jgi:hypothetical protein
MRKVAVFFGGKSCENEISILTGIFILNLLDREKFTPFPIYIHTDGGMYTSSDMTNLNVFKEKRVSAFERIFLDGGSVYALNEKKSRVKRLAKIDVAINCCHGGLGEGGGVSALAAWNGIPLASPDLTASGVFMDKGMTKLIFIHITVTVAHSNITATVFSFSQKLFYFSCNKVTFGNDICRTGNCKIFTFSVKAFRDRLIKLPFKVVKLFGIVSFFPFAKNNLACSKAVITCSKTKLS